MKFPKSSEQQVTGIGSQVANKKEGSFQMIMGMIEAQVCCALQLGLSSTSH